MHGAVHATLLCFDGCWFSLVYFCLIHVAALKFLAILVVFLLLFFSCSFILLTLPLIYTRQCPFPVQFQLPGSWSQGTGRCPVPPHGAVGAAEIRYRPSLPTCLSTAAAHFRRPFASLINFYFQAFGVISIPLFGNSKIVFYLFFFALILAGLYFPATHPPHSTTHAPPGQFLLRRRFKRNAGRVWMVSQRLRRATM